MISRQSAVARPAAASERQSRLSWDTRRNRLVTAAEDMSIGIFALPEAPDVLQILPASP